MTNNGLLYSLNCLLFLRNFKSRSSLKYRTFLCHPIRITSIIRSSHTLRNRVLLVGLGRFVLTSSQFRFHQVHPLERARRRTIRVKGRIGGLSMTNKEDRTTVRVVSMTVRFMVEHVERANTFSRANFIIRTPFARRSYNVSHTGHFRVREGIYISSFARPFLSLTSHLLICIFAIIGGTVVTFQSKVLRIRDH